MAESHWNRADVLRSAATATGLAMVGFPNIARAQAQTVRIGVLNISGDAPYLISDKKGFWKDEGLNIETTIFQSAGDMVVPMSQDALDSSGGTLSAGLYNGVARGLTSRAVASKGNVAPNYATDKLIVRSDLIKSGRFKTVRDLKGLSIGCNALGSGSSAALFRLLVKNGLSWADVRRQELPFPEHVAAIENGKIDAAYSTEPFVTFAQESGAATIVMSEDQWYPNQQIAAVVLGGDFMKKRPELARKFMRGYVRGVRYYIGALKGGKVAGRNASVVLQILTDVMHPKDVTLYTRTTALYVNPDAQLDKSSMQQDFNYFSAQSLLAKPGMSINDVIDGNWLSQALQDVGPYKPAKA